MEKDRLTRYFFIGLLVVLLYLTFIMVKPFLAYVAMGLILTYLMYPLYKKLNNKIPNKGIASGLMILIILLVLIIPSIFIVRTLIVQATVAVNMLKTSALQDTSTFLTDFGINQAQVNDLARDLLNNLSSFIVDSASSFVGSLPSIILGLFVLFFIMYYGFKEGSTLYDTLKDHIPLKKKHRDKLLSDIHSVSHAVLYGQVLTAVIQGAVGGIGFLIFGIPNPVFWGFIMIILSFLPVIGTPIVWGPAGIIELVQGDYVAGVGILIYSGVLVLNIDNVLRPKLISERAQIHPVIILIGVLGGLSVFGFSGIVLGPLVMGLLITMLKFYTEESSFVI